MTDQDTMPALDLEGLPMLGNGWPDLDAAFRKWTDEWSDCANPLQSCGPLWAFLASKMKRALSATPLSQAPAGQGVGVEEATVTVPVWQVQFWKEAAADRSTLWHAINPPGPRCRDCGDEDGRCPSSGQLCDPQAAALETLAAQPTQDDAKRLREALEWQPLASVLTDVWKAAVEGRDCAETLQAAITSIQAAALTPTSKTGDTDHAPEQ